MTQTGQKDHARQSKPTLKPKRLLHPTAYLQCNKNLDCGSTITVLYFIIITEQKIELRQ